MVTQLTHLKLLFFKCFCQTQFASSDLWREVEHDWQHCPHLQLRTKLQPSEVTTETATTIELYFTLDLPITKLFYIKKRKQL